MRILLAALGAAAMCAPLAAAQPRAPSAGLAPLDTGVVVARVREVIAERYVLPERRPALDAVLAEGLSSGRYRVTDPEILAGRINADLERVGRDKHLNFTFNPRQAATLVARDDARAPDPSAFERQTRSQNHGITELRVLPDNIRYMALDQFRWIGAESAAALDHAMRFLAGGDAIIIDLRRNGGGSAQAVDYLISHFLPARIDIYAFYQGSEASRAFTLADLPSGRVVDRPLYVLISRDTFSAAEAFAGLVAGHRLGEVIGENTGGGGFMNDLVPIDGRFVLSVSVARVVLTSTGRDWEAVGIAPTVPTPAQTALDVAHARALRRLASGVAVSERATMEAMAEGIQARVTPGTPAASLDAYAGVYGERSLVVEDGKLWYRVGSGRRRQLVPLGDHRFTLIDSPVTRLTFHASDGRVTAFDLGPATGPAQGRYERTR